MTIAGRLTYNYNRELLYALPGFCSNKLLWILSVSLRFSHKHLIFNLVNLVYYYYLSVIQVHFIAPSYF
jgi:hypothetical protein